MNGVVRVNQTSGICVDQKKHCLTTAHHRYTDELLIDLRNEERRRSGVPNYYYYWEWQKETVYILRYIQN